jgi:hypothetical protein
MTTMNDDLDTLRLPDLQTRFAEVIGEPTRSPNRVYLIRRIREADAAHGTATTEHAPPPEPAAAAEPGAAPAHAAPESETETATAQEPAAVGAPAPAEPREVLLTLRTTVLPRKLLLQMSVEQLHAMYNEVVQRPTQSTDVAYLVWKIRTTQRNNAAGSTAPARTRNATPAESHRVIPLRLAGELVDLMDAAWRRAGLSSRTEFLRRAIERELVELSQP